MQQLNDGENTKTDEDNSNQLNQSNRHTLYIVAHI